MNNCYVVKNECYVKMDFLNLSVHFMITKAFAVCICIVLSTGSIIYNQTIAVDFMHLFAKHKTARKNHEKEKKRLKCMPSLSNGRIKCVLDLCY